MASIKLVEKLKAFGQNTCTLGTSPHRTYWFRRLSQRAKKRHHEDAPTLTSCVREEGGSAHTAHPPRSSLSSGPGSLTVRIKPDLTPRVKKRGHLSAMFKNLAIEVLSVHELWNFRQAARRHTGTAKPLHQDACPLLAWPPWPAIPQ